MDACCLAGGSYSREDGPEAGDYVKTEFAQHGDVGTQVLKPVPGHSPPKYKVRLLVGKSSVTGVVTVSVVIEISPARSEEPPK